MIRRSVGILVALLGSGVLAIGCSSSNSEIGGSKESAGSVSQAIAGGSNDDNSPVSNVVVRLAGSSDPTLGGQNTYCSGTLITPRIVLTAAHCVNGDVGGSFGAKPGFVFPVSVQIGNTIGGPLGVYTVSQRSQAKTLFTTPQTVSAHGTDLALLFLDSVATGGAADQYVIDAPASSNPRQNGPQPYIVHPTLLGPGATQTQGLVGWSLIDSATNRQLALDSPGSTSYDDDDPGGGWGNWEHYQGSIHGDFGDSGGPIFRISTDSRGVQYRDVFGVMSGTQPVLGGDYDEYADITDHSPNAKQWLLSQIVDTTRSSKWLASHPGYSWYGDVEYPGACDAANDADCDHWTNAHDNCPNYNPGQEDSRDSGIGDACYPAVRSVYPTSGRVGTVVQITGTGFVPGQTQFQWLTAVTCTSSTSCQGTVKGAPLYTATVRLSAYTPLAGTTVYGASTDNDYFTITGSGGSGCTSALWTCTGSHDQTTDASFQCPTEPVGSTYKLQRYMYLALPSPHWDFADVPTNVTFTGGSLSAGPTALDEYGYVPSANETTVTYRVCLVRNSDATAQCGDPITLQGTTSHCPCQPDSCTSKNACYTTVADGCGGTLSCGACADGSSCSAGQCQSTTPPDPECTPAMAKRHECS